MNYVTLSLLWMGGRAILKILVDADACPVKQIIEKIAKEFQLELIFVIDTSHILYSDYAKVITVSKGPDAADFALINLTKEGDIVVTQDYGVAAMALGKKAYAIHHTGRFYTNENIEQKLFERHIAKKQRRAGMKSGKHKKFTEQDMEHFEIIFREFIQQHI
jgi:uncharacterized protein YaiI (UPF0178 family)